MTERDPSYSWAEAWYDEWRVAWRNGDHFYIGDMLYVAAWLVETWRMIEQWEATGAAPYRRDRGKERG